LRQQAQRLDDLDMRLRRAFMLNLNQRRERLARLDARLAAQRLDPADCALGAAVTHFVDPDCRGTVTLSAHSASGRHHAAAAYGRQRFPVAPKSVLRVMFTIRCPDATR
jgi:exonuclease VII large subunit